MLGVWSAVSALLHKPLQHVQGQRKHDGGVLLGGDGAESLQVAQLQRGWRLADDVSSLLQCQRRLLFALGSDHLVWRTDNINDVQILARLAATRFMRVDWWNRSFRAEL